MMNELKELLNKGGEEKVFTKYAVEIGDALWTALYSHVEGAYEIESVCEEGETLFAVLVADGKYYRLNFSFVEDVFTPAGEAELMEEYTPFEEAQFSAEAVAEYAKAKKDKAAKDDKDSDNKEDDDDQEEKCPKCGKKKSECVCEDKDDDDEKNKKGKKSKYVLEEIQEYVELSEKYSALEVSHNETLATIENLNNQIAELTAFKKGIEKAEKEKMIESFYMLSDEDKKDVVANIDTYSLEDIEAKLSIICVRNKVNFSLEDDRGTDNNDPTIFNLNGNIDDGVPAWIKSLRNVAKDM